MSFSDGPSDPADPETELSADGRSLTRGGEPVPDGMALRALATLDPGYFALVMASGIVSVGTDLTGHQLLSLIILGVTVVAFVALAIAYVARFAFFRAHVRQSLRDPDDRHGLLHGHCRHRRVGRSTRYG